MNLWRSVKETLGKLSERLTHPSIRVLAWEI